MILRCANTPTRPHSTLDIGRRTTRGRGKNEYGILGVLGKINTSKYLLEVTKNLHTYTKQIKRNTLQFYDCLHVAVYEVIS